MSSHCQPPCLAVTGGSKVLWFLDRWALMRPAHSLLLPIWKAGSVSDPTNLLAPTISWLASTRCTTSVIPTSLRPASLADVVLYEVTGFDVVSAISQRVFDDQSLSEAPSSHQHCCQWTVVCPKLLPLMSDFVDLNDSNDLNNYGKASTSHHKG